MPRTCAFQNGLRRTVVDATVAVVGAERNRPHCAVDYIRTAKRIENIASTPSYCGYSAGSVHTRTDGSIGPLTNFSVVRCFNVDLRRLYRGACVDPVLSCVDILVIFRLAASFSSTKGCPLPSPIADSSNDNSNNDYNFPL